MSGNRTRAIKRIFAELDAQGKLDGIVQPRKLSKPRQPKAIKVETYPEPTDPKSNCCKIKWAGQLPQGFRPCLDCPIDFQG